MIRLTKSANIPASLLRGTSHSDDDVIEALIVDHHQKCYLCERVCVTDYQVEHIESEVNNPEKRTEWTNLFFSCSYCNGKKNRYFDNILNPTLYDVEDIIESRNDWANKKVDFINVSEGNNQSVEPTISLLKRIFNGTDVVRKIKEERFYEYYLSRMATFRESLRKYLVERSEINKNAIIEELEIGKEFLSFKYHIIKNNTVLNPVFEQYMVWNKNQSITNH